MFINTWSLLFKPSTNPAFPKHQESFEAQEETYVVGTIRPVGQRSLCFAKNGIQAAVESSKGMITPHQKKSKLIHGYAETMYVHAYLDIQTFSCFQSILRHILIF